MGNPPIRQLRRVLQGRRLWVDDRLRHWRIRWPPYWRVWQDGVVGYYLPVFWLWPIVKAKFPNANLHPAFNYVRLFLPFHPFVLIANNLDV
jgi:hypothetical protein